MLSLKIIFSILVLLSATQLGAHGHSGLLFIHSSHCPACIMMKSTVIDSFDFSAVGYASPDEIDIALPKNKIKFDRLLKTKIKSGSFQNMVPFLVITGNKPLSGSAYCALTGVVSKSELEKWLKGRKKQCV